MGFEMLNSYNSGKREKHFSLMKLLCKITVVFIVFLTGTVLRAQDKQPNIVFIMIDDLGYGDIGCYGSEHNLTPNIDFLAKGGMRFTDYHSNGAMCSPTRAALMTGQYQYRYGERFEGPLSSSRKDSLDDGLPNDTYTIAEALKNKGYSTGMYGKWHLGVKPPMLPSDQGFDDFIGLGYGDGDHFTHIDRVGNKDWWHNDKLEMEEGYSVDLITNHSVDFIKKNRDTPFFLYVAHLAIHFPWQGPGDPPHRIEGRDYRDDKWGIIPDRKNVQPHIKAMVEAVDESVGKIMKTLKELGLEENTLVIFTSDNGGYIEYKSGGFENISSNGPLRGQKASIYEGGHRVPFIAYWPGKIKAGAVSDETVMTMDMFPTFTELTRAGSNENINFDGRNILPVLFRNEKMDDRAISWKIRENRAIRKGEWKLDILGQKPPELYNLSDDIGEKVNLSNKRPELVKNLLAEYKIWEADVTANYEKKQ